MNLPGIHGQKSKYGKAARTEEVTAMPEYVGGDAEILGDEEYENGHANNAFEPQYPPTPGKLAASSDAKLLAAASSDAAGPEGPVQHRCWNNIVEMVGALAGICTTAAFIPQVYEISVSGDTSGLSPAMYTIFVSGVFLWIVYGVCKKAGSLVMANLVTFALAGFIWIAIMDRVVFHPENYASDVDPGYADAEGIASPPPLGPAGAPMAYAIDAAASPPPPLPLPTR